MIQTEVRKVDTETGEVFDNRFSKYPLWSADKGYKFRLGCNQSRVFSDVSFPKDLSVSDLGRILLLQRFIQKDTNILVKRTSGGYRNLTTSQVIKAVGLKERQGRSFIRKLIRVGIIGRVDVCMEDKTDYHYLFNPIYFHNSKYLNKYLYQTFKQWLDPYLSKWVRDKLNE